MKDFIQQHSSGVLVGIISTMLFLYFIQPIFEFIVHLVIQFGSLIGAAYVDEIFASVSHLEVFDYSFLLVTIVLGIVSGSSLSAVLLIWRKPRKSNKEKPEKPEELEVTKASSGLGRKVFSSFLMLIIGLGTIAFLATRVYQLNLISSFEQHVRILAPYISDQEEEVFISRWSRMETEENYELIYVDLNALAKENDIELPSNRIYTLTSI